MIGKIKYWLNSFEIVVFLLGMTLSFLLIGYAPSSILLGGVVLFSLRYALINRRVVTIDYKLVIPVLLYVLFLLSLFWTVNIEDTKLGLERTVSILVVPLIFNFIPRFSQNQYEKVFNLFTGANICLGIFFLWTSFRRYKSTGLITEFTYHDLVSILDLNAIYVSFVFSISLFYLLPKAQKKLKDIFMILFLFILLVLLSSKIMLLVLILGVIIYLLRKEISKIKVFLTIFMFGVIVASVSSIKLTERFLFEKDTNFVEVLTKTKFGQVYPWTGSSVRLLQLRILKEQLEEESIFWSGFGLFASRDNLIKRHTKLDTYATFHEYNYHNQYAQVFSEVGVFGLVLLILMIGVIIEKGIKNGNFLMIMFGISSIFVFLTESLLWRQQGQFLFILLYCLMLRTKSINKVGVVSFNTNESY